LAAQEHRQFGRENVKSHHEFGYLQQTLQISSANAIDNGLREASTACGCRAAIVSILEFSISSICVEYSSSIGTLLCLNRCRGSRWH